jgi:hypothetical protein
MGKVVETDRPQVIWFVYSFVHSVTNVTMDMSITVYNLYITIQLIIYGHPKQYNIINNNTKFEGQFEVESVTTSRYMCIYMAI